MMTTERGATPGPRVLIDTGRLWGGGVASGLVAALVALVGVLICSIVDVRLVRPALLLDVLDSFAGDYALTAFLLTLVATGVAHLVSLTTPRPRMFFSWIIVLATVAGIVAPFAVGDDTESQVATACINLALGICVLSLVGGVMSRTVVLHRSPVR
jgi:uncharacterized protein DUF6069